MLDEGGYLTYESSMQLGYPNLAHKVFETLQYTAEV